MLVQITMRIVNSEIFNFILNLSYLGGINNGDKHLGGACLGLEGVGESASEANEPCASGACRTSREAARSGEGDRGTPAIPASNVRPSGAKVRIAGDDPR